MIVSRGIKFYSFFLLFYTFLIHENFIYAQNVSKKTVKILSCNKGDKIILRWAPTHPSVWQAGNETGYILEKYILYKDGKALSLPLKLNLTASFFKPKPLAEWQDLVQNKKDKYASIGAQSIFGKSFVVDAKNSNVFQMIDKAKEIENRWSFALFSADQSIQVSELMGLRYEDKEIRKGERYLYRIFPAKKISGEKVDTGFVFVDADQMTTYTLPTNFKMEVEGKMAKLTFDNRLHQQFYSGYFFERSEDGKTWEARNKEPYINSTANGDPVKTIVYFDSIPSYDKTYFYRFKAKTYFGETTPPSTVVSGMSRIPLQVTPNIINVSILQNLGIKIDWEFKKESNKDVLKFKLYAASKAKGPYKILQTAKPEERSLILKQYKPISYFVIGAVGKDSSENKSTPFLFQAEDSLAPAIPVILTSKIDSNGIVKIYWKKNKEEDLMGYRIFKANALTDPFINLSSKINADTSFSDSVNLKTLTKKIYYKITALDNHFNSSDFSKLIELTKPDKMPPSSPVWKHYLASDTAIVLRWINSGSADVVGHVLYRSLAGTNEWKILSKFDTTVSKINQETEYIDRDKSLERGTFYEYAVIAIDDSKNESPLSQPIKIKKIDNGLRQAIEKISGLIEKDKNQILIKWEYPYENVEKMLVYRKSNEDSLRIIKGVYIPTNEFSDKMIKLNTTYVYKLRAVYKNGSSSPFSRDLILKF
ncbi:MAG: hypothetical protein EAZ07_09345 [Cytophagales bacterium]|nr:MAG: hypothetical protein EAZ07_09345 [Cytophagales bacterium]